MENHHNGRTSGAVVTSVTSSLLTATPTGSLSAPTSVFKRSLRLWLNDITSNGQDNCRYAQRRLFTTCQHIIQLMNNIVYEDVIRCQKELSIYSLDWMMEHVDYGAIEEYPPYLGSCTPSLPPQYTGRKISQMSRVG